MAGSTDFVQFNPPISNIETDAQYIADSLRSAGITTDAILASKLLNKVFYQSSTLAAALGLMMANKGYSPVDGSSPFSAAPSPSVAVAGLAGVLANIQTAADLVNFTNGAHGSGYFQLPTAFGGIIFNYGNVSLTANVVATITVGKAITTAIGVFCAETDVNTPVTPHTIKAIFISDTQIQIVSDGSIGADFLAIGF